MNQHQAQRARLSRSDFELLVWPLLKGYIGGLELLANERRPEDPEVHVRTELDMVGGIDWWIGTAIGMYGLGSRVQWEEDYRTFTVRYELPSGRPTEYEKRSQAIAEGSLYPHWTAQAYLDKPGGYVKSAAVCWTPDIYAYLASPAGQYCRILTARSDGNKFKAVDWKHLSAYRLFVWTRPAPSRGHLRVVRPDEGPQGGLFDGVQAQEDSEAELRDRLARGEL